MGTSSPLASIAVLVGLTLACLAIFAWTLRGRRVATGPRCRRCGYDVSQRPANVERCSECGADLAAPRAIVTGRRVVNRWLAIPAGVAVGLLVALLAMNAVGLPWRAWLLANAPIGWVQGIARRDHGPGGDPYRVAWQTRAFNDGFVDHLLDLQGDRSTTWRVPFGDLLVGSMASMSDAQRDRFVRQMFGPPTFRVRSPVRAGDPLPIEVTWPLRGSANVSLYDARDTLAARADVPAGIANRYWSFGMPSDHASTSIQAKDWAGANLAPGPHRVSVALRRQLLARDNPNIDRRTPVGPAVDDAATLDVEVLPADAPIGHAVPAPEQGDAIAQAVTVGVYHWHDGRCFAEVRLLPAFADRAFGVYAVIDGVEKRIGAVCAKANGEGTTNAIYVPVSNARAAAMTSLTLVLVGEGEPLAGTIDQQRYWPGRIVYAYVPLGTFADYQADGQAPLPHRPTTVPYRLEAATTAPATRPG